MWGKNVLIDNTDNNTLAQYIRYGLLDAKCRELCIATGYWDIPGMALLHTEFEKFFARGGTFRMIIGEEPVARQYQLAPERVEAIRKFPDDYIKLDIDDLKEEYKPVIRLLLQYCKEEESPIQIRIYGQNVNPKRFLHAKCYIFRGTDSVGIIGSANFTYRGLVDNTELSYLETNSSIVGAWPNQDSTFKGHIAWFEEKWENSVPWEQVFKKEILEPSPIGSKVKQEMFALTPYMVYIKYLQSIFGTDGNDNIKNNFLPKVPNFKLLDYQIDAVNRGYSIMREHHGFILADVVGLGKTITAMMLANKFMNTPDPDGREKEILIITPPAVKNSWIQTIELFDTNSDSRLKNHITIITTGKVVNFAEFDEEAADTVDDGDNTSLSLEKKNYGLIIIDESHKFRNSNTQMYKAMDELLEQIYPQPYMVLLSATPQNNSPQDLKNQIFLFQREPQNTTLETIDGRKLDTYFSKKQKDFDTAKRNQDYQAIKNLSLDIRQRVLDQLLVRRTRTDIRTHYGSDAADLRFPAISGPHPLKYTLNSKLSKLFFDTMNLIAPTDPITGEFILSDDGLSFERYRAIEYLVSAEDKKRYQVRNLTPEGTSKRLAKIMQILLVKRLESSIAAFRTSLIHLKRYTQNMVDMLNDDCVFICPDIDVNAELDYLQKNVTKEQCYEDLRALIKRKGGNNYEYKTAAFSPKYRERLNSDLRKISNLCDRWSQVSIDPKLQVFQSELTQQLLNPETNNPHHFDSPKLIIFSEAIDTVEQLKDTLEGAGYRVLAITADNRDKLNETISLNFDANVEKDKQKNDYDILITTEVLAEGVNLHRANVILNYDTPWNSTRLMQRIGRVNRIGSKEDFVHVYNFMPTAEGDQQIELVNKAHTKLQAFHALFGEDSQIFTSMEEVPSYGSDPAALRKLVEGELSPLEPFAAELRNFQHDDPILYERIAKLPAGTGCARPGDNARFCCVVKHPSRHSGLNLILEKEDAKDISCLDMLNLLKCNPDTPSVPLSADELESFNVRATAKYNEFMQKMMTAADGNKKRTAALKAIREIKKSYSLNEAANTLLNLADSLVRKNDRALIRRIIKLQQELSDHDFLPGLEMGERDINAFLEQELQALAKRNQNDSQPPEISLYMADKEA